MNENWQFGGLVPLEELLKDAKQKSCSSCKYATFRIGPPVREYWMTKAGKMSKTTRLFQNIIDDCKKGKDRTKGVCPEFEFSEFALKGIKWYEHLIKRGYKNTLDINFIEEEKEMKG